MDPWASDNWNQIDNHPQLVHDPLNLPSPDLAPLQHQSQPNWHSDPILSLPNWDSPADSDPRLPSSSDSTNQPPLSTSFASSSSLHPVPVPVPAPDPLPNPLWSTIDSPETKDNPIAPSIDVPSTIQVDPALQHPLENHPLPQPAPITLNSTHSPTDSDHSIFKTPQGSIHNWPDLISSSVSLPSQEPPSTPVQLDLSPLDDHQPETKPDLNNDDDRWGSFTQTPVLSSSSALPFSNPPDIPPHSPIQAGWEPDPGFGGWDSHASLDAVALSLGTSVGHDDDEKQPEKGWETPTLDDGLAQIKDDQEEPPVEDVQDAWAGIKPRDVHELPSDILGKHQLAAQKWAQDQWPVQEENFLPPGKAAMPLDLSSALSPGGELAGTLAELTQDPLPETSATRTQLLFQNSATAEAFQHAISKTATAAANVLKSANRSRRLFPIGPQSGPSPLRDTTSLPAPGQLPADDAIWNDFSALEVPHHPHDANTDVFGLYESQQTAQQQQSKRSSFFGRWTAKSPPPTNTPATLLAKKVDDGLIGLPPVAGLAVTPKQSLSLSRDATSSRNTSPSGGPTPSSSGPSESPQDPPPSRISRLFGRFGTRPTHASLSSPEKPSFSDLTTATTELDEREASCLDAAQTVPVEPGLSPYDAVSPSIGLQLDLAPPRRPDPGSDLPDFLADPAPPASSPLNRRHTREILVTKSRQGVASDPFGFFDSPPSLAMAAQPRRSQFSRSPPSADVSGVGHMSLLDAFAGSSAGLVSLSQQTHGPGAVPRTPAPASTSQPTDDLDMLFAHFQSSVTSSAITQRSAVGGQAKVPTSTGAIGKKAPGMMGGATPTTVRMSAGAGGRNGASGGGGAVMGRVPVLAPPPGTNPVPLIPPPERTQQMGSGNHDEVVKKVGGQQGRLQGLGGPAGGGGYMYGGSINHNNSISSQKSSGGNQLSSSSNSCHNQNIGGGGGGVGLSKQDLSFFDSLM